MITTDAPAWLRRSDRAVTWVRTMLTPRHAVVIDCETTDLPGGDTGRMSYQNLRNTGCTETAPLTEIIMSAQFSTPPVAGTTPKVVSRLMQYSCI
jgi:hypothetical protein